MNQSRHTSIKIIKKIKSKTNDQNSKVSPRPVSLFPQMFIPCCEGKRPPRKPGACATFQEQVKEKEPW